MKNMHSHRGFTINELLVTMAIMGFLGGIAVPKYFSTVEKTRQKVDQTKLYHLRDALNMALIEDLGALTNYSAVSTKDNKTKTIENLEKYLMSKTGATLFVIELHNGLSINVQGSHGSANNSTNVCQVIGNSGTWYTALKESGFEGVAEIVADRILAGNGKAKFYNGGATYCSTPYTNSSGKTDYRTAPKKALFLSRALNFGKENLNTRYTMNIRWSGGMSESMAVEVALLPNGGSFEDSYKTDEGVCFSTLGNAGCSVRRRR